MINKFVFVTATRLCTDDFFVNAPLGKSLKQFYESHVFNPDLIKYLVYDKNTRSLSSIYNEALELTCSEDVIMVFIHDDVTLLDYFICERLVDALSRFSLVGIAGCIKRSDDHVSWALVNNGNMITMDSFNNLSGTVGHGCTHPPFNISRYGPSMQNVELIDGVIIAGYNSTFIKNNIRFNELFDFHFYDLDLCRQFKEKGLSIGTFETSLIHASEGNFDSSDWKKNYFLYKEIWGS